MLVGEALEDALGEGRFPASRCPGDENGRAVGIEPDFFALRVRPDEDRVARQPGFEIGEIAGDQLVDQLDDAVAIPGGSDPIGPLLHERQRVGDRHAALAEPEKGVVVLGVAHADAVVRREPQLEQRGVQAGRLVRARRQDHDRALVEDDLQLEAEIADRVEDDAFIGLPRRDEGVPDGQRGDLAGAKRLHEVGARRLAENLVLAARGTVEDSAVLGDDPIEEIDRREDVEEILELPPCGEDELAPRVAKALERRERLDADLSIARERSVEIAGQDEIAHGPSTTLWSQRACHRARTWNRRITGVLTRISLPPTVRHTGAGKNDQGTYVVISKVRAHCFDVFAKGDGRFPRRCRNYPIWL